MSCRKWCNVNSTYMKAQSARAERRFAKAELTSLLQETVADGPETAAEVVFRQVEVISGRVRRFIAVKK